MADEGLDRRAFLRGAGGALAAAALGGAALGGAAACGGGSGKAKVASPTSTGQGRGKAAGASRPTLRIAQISHFVPAFDAWFDGEYATRWGDEHDVDVVVDHIPIGSLAPRAATEVASRAGHDIFTFYSPPGAFEDDVIDHRELVEEAEAKVGAMNPIARRSTFNPKTGKWFGFPDYLTPFVTHYRSDLWPGPGAPAGPDTWDALLRAGPRLRAAGHPLGLDLSEDYDGNENTLALMFGHGASIQDEHGEVVIGRPATVEAVKVATAIFRAGMTDEVLSWEASSNNRYLASGKGSLILNAVSALRAVEKQDPGLAGNVALAPPPAGPAARLGTVNASVSVIWRFAANQDAAKRFLVDLAVAYREAFVHSELYNVPAFPGSVPDLAELAAGDTATKPAGKYALLAHFTEWNTNIGHPGSDNAATDEVANQYLIPKMFASAARGTMTAEEAVKAAEAQMQPIFAKWRERGKI